MAIGGAIGVASTVGVSYANGISPWTGKSLNTSISSQVKPNDLNTYSDVFTVTSDGIVLPKGAYIPDNLIENPYGRFGSYGKIVDGKFIEIVRIDPTTLPGYKGPNTSHFHLNGNKTHIFDINRWPWWHK